MDNKIYIFGCGGHTRSIINVAKRLNENMEIILVDNNCLEDEVILGCETMREDNFWTKANEEFQFIVGIGDNEKRKQKYQLAISNGGKAINIIAKTAILSMECTLGDGIFIAEKAYIGPEVSIGNNAIINTDTVIEHECKIGENVHVAPNATICGRSKIGNNSMIGAGSTVIDRISITENVLIGAGSVVIKSVDEKGIYVGCPIKKTK